MLRYRIALRNDKVAGLRATEHPFRPCARSTSAVRRRQNGTAAIFEGSRALRYYQILFQDMTRKMQVLSAAAGLLFNVTCFIQDNYHSTVDARDERVKEQICSIRR